MAYSPIEESYMNGYVSTQFTTPEPEPVLLAQNKNISYPGEQFTDTGGGAAVGTRLNMPKGLNTLENIQKVGGEIIPAGAAMVKGAGQASVGMYGDIEGLGRMVLNYMGVDVNKESKLPTTEDVKTFLDKYIPVDEKYATFESAGELASPAGAYGLGKAGVKVIKSTKGLPVGMSIKNVAPLVPAQVNTDPFKNWFGDWKTAPESASKVVDESGAPLAVYHGTGRPDRVGEQFRKSRATSGPMSFFTDNPEIASGYAKGKTDTSISYEDNAYDYANWFKKKVGKSTLNLDQAGARMSMDERQLTIDKLRDINIDEDTGEIVYKKGGGSIMTDSSFDWYLKNEAKGNPLTLANKLWLESGTLYGREEEFAKVLKLADVKGFDYTSPHEKNPAVYKVYLDIKKPLATDEIPDNVIANLEQAASRVRKPTQRGGADNWDKNTVAPDAWIERLKSDIKDGTTHAWTSIPDWVTKTLKNEGYDGIKDTGGKSGGVNHAVWIPFEENQVKSAMGNKGTFDPKSKNILRGAVTTGGAGASQQEESK